MTGTELSQRSTDGATSNPIVRVENLTKKYFPKKALDNVTLDIKKGLIVGLLGPNGSGKSTLLKCITGLTIPSSGTVSIEGDTPRAKTRAKIAYLPEVDPIYKWMSVKETIDLVSAFYDDFEAERVEDLYTLLKLNPTDRAGSMSKGQRARLKLMTALSRNAPLVLLDEPLSGIDPPSRSRIIQAIVSHYRAGEQTIILSTHEVAESESIFDEVVFLDNGRVRLQGSAEQVRSEKGCSIEDLLEEVYA